MRQQYSSSSCVVAVAVVDQYQVLTNQVAADGLYRLYGGGVCEQKNNSPRLTYSLVMSDSICSAW